MLNAKVTITQGPHKGKTGRIVGIYVQDKKYDVRIHRQYVAIPFNHVKNA
ncbi:MAG TPA: KOW motif-containing protein [Anaerohalosphaeraceae bacterium]|nr:KOW motif-containing protein [Anaerohalosphaeraceae bacterium]HRS71448.1 KOW motif-containing protein [Anaerohalosphaeraceae bacterium]